MKKFTADIEAGRIVLLPHDSAIETHFQKLVLGLHRRQPPVVIRTFDAIHLATAELLGASEVITTDLRMRDGAAALGMQLFP